MLREAERERLARGLREAHKAQAAGRRGEDRGEDLNGMPRWLAFEERYVVAERSGKILAALRYRTESKRLLLGLLVGDPWAEERPLAVALYAGAGRLAREMGVGEILARPFPRATD